MFHSFKSAINIGDVNTGNIIIFDKYPCAKEDCKIFFGCRNNEEVVQLCILLPKMIAYVKNFDDVKTMSFSVKDAK